MTKKQGKLALYIGQIAIQGILVILIALFLAKVKSLSDLYQSLQLAGDNIEGFIESLGFGFFKYINNFKDMISYLGFIKFLFFINLILLLVAIFIFKANLYEYVFSAASCGLMLISYILIHPLVSFLNLAKSTLKGINFMNPNFDALSGIEEKFENLGLQIQNLIFTFSPGRAKFAGVLLVLAIISFIASIYFLVMALTKKKYENVDDVDLEAVKESFKGSYKEAKRTLANASEGLSKKLREEDSDNEVKDKKEDFSENKVNPDQDFDKTRVLNRDDILNESFDKKEKKPSNSGEIRHGAYDFSSGFKKNYSDEHDGDKNIQDEKKDFDHEKINFDSQNEDLSHDDNENVDNNFKKTEKINKSDDFKKSTNPNGESSISLSKDQKKYVFIGLGVLAAIILFFAAKSIFFALKPDAEFDTSAVDLKFNVEGYSGYAKASASTTAAPVLSQFKNKYLQKDIEEAYTQKITLDKEKNIKNGDVVTATVEYTALPPYKVSFSDDKIEKKFKVKGLDKFLNSYKDLSQDTKDKFEGAIQKKISDQYISDGSGFSTKTKNLKMELVGIFENKVPKDAISNNGVDKNGKSHKFQLAYIYKVTYDKVSKSYDDDDNEVEKLEPKETVIVYQVDDISENNGAVNYNIHSPYSDLDEADAINKIKYDGFNKVDSKKE